MKDPAEIKKLAYERLEEAEILHRNNKHDGAFYLSGYSVELMLKAKVCERISVPNLFDEDDKVLNATSGISEIRRFLKTHNLHILLIFSGLREKFENDKISNTHLLKANSLLFSNWNETSRYKPCGFMDAGDVTDLLSLLKDPDGLLLWIEKN